MTSVSSLDRSETSVPGGDVTGPAETGPTAPEPTLRPPGIPPAGATPSLPETGELILGVSLMSDSPDRETLTHMFVYADGRLIWSRDGDLPEGADRYHTGLVEQRLTPEGVELLRSEVISSGLIDPHSVMVDGEADPDPFPLLGWINVREADRLVGREFAFEAYQTGGPHHEGETTCRPAWGCAHIATAEEERRLQRLSARLTDPASWLPASAWADQEVRAHVPSTYHACYGGYSETIEPARILNALPGPAGKGLRGGEPDRIMSGGYRNFVTYYCSDITSEHAYVIVRALDDAGIQRELGSDSGTTFAYDFSVPGSGQMAQIRIDPYLPHGDPICIPCSWPFSIP
jgi:hypothetical protein